MRFIDVDDDKIIMLNNNYYIVNDLTYKLLHMYYSNMDISEISSILEIPENEVQKKYNELSDLILEDDTYNKDISLEDGPMKIQWKITNRCNIRCKHCYEGNKDNYEMSEEEIEKIFDMLSHSNLLSLTISGGEALLVKNLAKNVIKLVSKGISVKIFTNGILLDKFIKEVNSFDAKFEKSLLTFTVSVDGTKTIHDTIREKGCYKKTIQNIQFSINNGYIVSTNTVMNKLNINSIIEMVKTLHDIGVRDIQLSNLFLSGWARDNRDQLYIDDEMEMREFYIKLISEVEFPVQFADASSAIAYRSMGKGKELRELGKSTWKCCAGQSRLTIEHNGNVVICPFLKDKVIGNVLKNDINEIWRNPLRFEYIKQLEKFNENSNVCFVYDSRGI